MFAIVEFLHLLADFKIEIFKLENCVFDDAPTHKYCHLPPGHSAKIVFLLSPRDFKNCLFESSKIEFLVVLGGLKNWPFGMANFCKH